MSLLSDVLLRGLAADRPAATDVPISTLYYSTDTYSIDQSNGTSWVSYSPGSGTLGIDQLTGDVTAGPGTGSAAATIANDAVTNAKAANMAQSTIKGRASGAGTGDPTDLTPDQASTVLDGATDPLTRKTYVDAAIAAAIPTTTAGSGLVSGGQVTWESDYVYRVSAASYYINGVLYTSPETQITLTAADATNDRIDSIVLTTSSTATKVDGTAAAQPSEPDIDPSTQLKLAIVLVTASTTAPVAASNVTVYAENAGSGGGEWDWTTSGSGFTLGSTNNPHAGTKDIEGTTVASGAYAQGQKGTGTIDPNSYDHLVLFIRSKAAWNSNRGLTITLRNAGVIIGAQINIRRTGTYGFDSTSTSGYQQIAIPIIDFAVPSGSLINQVRIADFGGSIGFYIDDIKFQTGASTQSISGITQDQADASYAPLGSAYAVIGSADATLPNERRLVAGSGITLTDGGAGSTLTIAASGGGGTPGGSNTQVQFNDSGAFGGTADLTFDKSSKVLTVTNALAIPIGGSAAAAAGAVRIPNNSSINARNPGNSGDVQLIWQDAAGNVRINDSVSNPLRATGLTRGITVVIDGGGSVITTGIKGDVLVPIACTIQKWTLLGDQSGSIQIDIWKDSYGNYPPTVADTIVASAPPNISAATKGQSSTLTGWTTTINAGDTIRFNVDSVTTLTRVMLYLELKEN